MLAWDVSPRNLACFGFSPTMETAAIAAVSMVGEVCLFDNNLELTSQAFTLRASGTQKRNFKKREQGPPKNLRPFSSRIAGTGPRLRLPWVWSSCHIPLSGGA